MRIACIQNGDFAEALEILEDDLPDPYFGMKASVRAVLRLLENKSGLVLSLDAKRHMRRRDNGTGALWMLDIPKPKFPVRRLRDAIRISLILYQLERFEPTHVLLRTGGQIGLAVAEWCMARRIPTLVLLANAVYDTTDFSVNVNKELMRTLNDPCFELVGNYKPIATNSMVEYGLQPTKAVSFIFDGERHPDQYAVKDKPSVCHIVFAARMVKAKGPTDLVEACKLLHEEEFPIQATMYGVGDDFKHVKELAKDAPYIQLPGQVCNETLFQSIRKAAFVCVPSRSTFVEGMPMALTESLAARTPVITSNCPVFKKAFAPNEGVYMFHEGRAQDLADLIRYLYEESDYRVLSERTKDSFMRVGTGKPFSELLTCWGN